MAFHRLVSNIDFEERTDVTSLNNAAEQLVNTVNAVLPVLPVLLLVKGAFILGKYHGGINIKYDDIVRNYLYPFIHAHLGILSIDE